MPVWLLVRRRSDRGRGGCYSRRGLRSASSAGPLLLGAGLWSCWWFSPYPVSYTHLDVYKRQIYNGLLQDEVVSPSEVKEFADLSEQELDRIETLVQNLLKITRLDAGSVILEKKNENVAEMVQDIARQYHYRAEQEQKKLVLSGSEAVTLWCDRDWMQEAVDNLVKNALDHTKCNRL